MTKRFFKNIMNATFSLLGLVLISIIISSCSLLQLIGSNESYKKHNRVNSFWVDSLGFFNKILFIGGTSIHYIDYGGKGQELVFLSGLGNTAHIFDEFAPRFTDNFHVIAITRRGFGESGKPDDGYNTERLTDDIKDLLDSLNLKKVILIGHSIAGDELSEFAVRYPHRIHSIVYLDAAYDRSNTTTRLLTLAIAGQTPPQPPNADEDDKKSPEAFQKYLKKNYGVFFPISEVFATRIFDSTGYYLSDVTSADVNFKIVQGEKEPEYEKIKVPALAFYAIDRNLDTDFAWTKEMFVGRGVIETKAMRYLYAQQNWEKVQRKKLNDELAGVKVIEISNASHFIFISHPNLVENEIRNFIKDVNVTSIVN